MKLTWLLEDTAISASARLVMAQADAMIARGHRARIVTAGTPVTWRSSNAEWIYVDELRQYSASDDDFVAEGALPMIIVDDEVYRAGSRREHEPLRVLLCGAAGMEGFEDGYGAVAHARWFHQTLDLIRVSPWAPSKDEPLDAVQEFHVALTTGEMTRLLHSCDVLIAPVFSLAVCEAMAAGIPCVVTASQPFHEHAHFAPDQNAVELGERLIEVLADEEDLRERLRSRGREAAEQWRSDKVAEQIEAYVERRRSAP